MEEVVAQDEVQPPAETGRSWLRGARSSSRCRLSG